MYEAVCTLFGGTLVILQKVLNISDLTVKLVSQAEHVSV